MIKNNCYLNSDMFWEEKLNTDFMALVQSELLEEGLKKDKKHVHHR